MGWKPHDLPRNCEKNQRKIELYTHFWHMPQSNPQGCYNPHVWWFASDTKVHSPLLMCQNSNLCWLNHHSRWSNPKFKWVNVPFQWINPQWLNRHFSMNWIRIIWDYIILIYNYLVVKSGIPAPSNYCGPCVTRGSPTWSVSHPPPQEAMEICINDQRTYQRTYQRMYLCTYISYNLIWMYNIYIRVSYDDVHLKKKKLVFDDQPWTFGQLYHHKSTPQDFDF